jgi:hypothetical protein
LKLYTLKPKNVNNRLKEYVEMRVAKVAHVLEVSGLTLVIVVMELGSGVTTEDTRATPYLPSLKKTCCVSSGSFNLFYPVIGVTFSPLLGPGFILIVELAPWAVRLSSPFVC